MAQLVSLLKSEITRLARKEIRSEVGSLRDSSGRYRSEIAALKRKVVVLERMVEKLTKVVAGSGSSREIAAEQETKLRFRPEGFAKLREKLNLSAAEMGKLVGVTQQTIYHWEKGQARPRASQLEQISKVRKLGKRGAAKALAELHSGSEA